MEKVRSAMVAKTLGASALALFVLALAACGETKPDESVVSAGRETAVVGSPAGSDSAQADKGTVGITEDPATLGDFGPKVVKSANLGLRSKEVRESAARAQQAAANAGGSVLSSQVYRSEDSVTAQLVLSVPSEEFEGVLDELRGLARRSRPTPSAART